MKPIVPAVVAEFLGTFALVFFGAGSIILTTDSPGAGAGLVSIAMAHGLVLVIFVSACMYISGAQFNPAVSIGLMSIGKQTPQRAAVFIVTQCVAAVAAAGLLLVLLGRDVVDPTRLGATLGSLSLGTENGNEPNIPAVFVIEMLMTFMLMFIILGAVVDERAHKLGGFGVGLAVATGIVAFGPLTGASMNPARSLGPAFYAYWDIHWVYWAAPITGAVLAAWTYKVFWLTPTREA